LYRERADVLPHLRPLREDGTIKTIEDFRTWVCMEGAFVEPEKCFWADEHAFKVISHEFDVGLLLIDMQRKKGAWPYRIVDDGKTNPTRYVVLKREAVGHFQYVTRVNGSGVFLAEDMPDVLQKLFKV